MKNLFKKKNELSQKTETVSLQIEGMTCSGCSLHIEKDINKKDGILIRIQVEYLAIVFSKSRTLKV